MLRPLVYTRRDADLNLSSKWYNRRPFDDEGHIASVSLLKVFGMVLSYISILFI